MTLTVPGIHNARNASAAIIAAALLGMDVERASAAVTSFLGAARRFQVRGTVSQVTVVDDYAHHPTEIAALLDAARRRYPQSKIRVIFQPHLVPPARVSSALNSRRRLPRPMTSSLPASSPRARSKRISPT